MFSELCDCFREKPRDAMARAISAGLVEYKGQLVQQPSNSLPGTSRTYCLKYRPIVLVGQLALILAPDADHSFQNSFGSPQAGRDWGPVEPYPHVP